MRPLHAAAPVSRREVLRLTGGHGRSNADGFTANEMCNIPGVARNWVGRLLPRRRRINPLKLKQLFHGKREGRSGGSTASPSTTGYPHFPPGIKEIGGFIAKPVHSRS